MPETNDMELMREFAQQNSEAAFAELARRHVDLVYSVALRFTGNAADARDVTQAVFIVFSKKAASLLKCTVLTGWLYETTRLTAASFLRAQARRRAHEQEAYMQSLTESDTNGVFQQIVPHLEAAMSRLSEGDRTLLALRFYENKSGAEAAALLGIHEQAAHKRTSRALEKLRCYFSRRGIAISAISIASAVSANAVQAAPQGLAAAVAATATENTVLSATLVKETIKTMTWLKYKFVCATTILIGVITTVALSGEKHALSQQSYSMKGDLIWTAGTNTGTYPVEILRDGTTFKITAILNTNYFTGVFLSTRNMAVSFSQYEKDITGVHKVNKSWNNGSITISHYRMPEDPQMAPIWLILKGNEEVERMNNLAPITIWPGSGEHLFHERPTVNPVTASDPSWVSGFSSYSEVVTNTEAGIIRFTSVNVQSWTNCAGIKFPASFFFTHTRTALHTNVSPKSLFSVEIRFQATQIEPLHEQIDTRLPFLSPVADWRPREDGRLPTGCSYDITNGVIFDDIIKAAALHKTKYIEAHDAAQSRGLAEGVMAPEFSGRTLEGNYFKLSDFRGKYVVLDFWSTTCGPCIGEMPKLKETYEAFRHDKRFVMIGLALNEDSEVVKAFVAKNEILWPQMVLNKGWGDPICVNYKIKGIPTSYVIDPDGKILAQLRLGKEYINSLLSK